MVICKYWLQDRSRAQSAAGSATMAAAPEQADTEGAGACARPPAESPDLFMPLPTYGMMNSSQSGMAASSSIPQQPTAFGVAQVRTLVCTDVACMKRQLNSQDG